MTPSESFKGLIEYEIFRNDEKQQIKLQIVISGDLYDLFPTHVPDGADEALAGAVLHWLAAISNGGEPDPSEIQ